MAQGQPSLLLGSLARRGAIRCPKNQGRGGVERLAALRQSPVDSLLTDLGMSEMSGRDVARAVMATAPGLPVILLTGWGEQPANQPEDPSVVDRILGKPGPPGRSFDHYPRPYRLLGHPPRGRGGGARADR